MKRTNLCRNFIVILALIMLISAVIPLQTVVFASNEQDALLAEPVPEDFSSETISLTPRTSEAKGEWIYQANEDQYVRFYPLNIPENERYAYKNNGTINLTAFPALDPALLVTDVRIHWLDNEEFTDISFLEELYINDEEGINITLNYQKSAQNNINTENQLTNKKLSTSERNAYELNDNLSFSGDGIALLSIAYMTPVTDFPGGTYYVKSNCNDRFLDARYTVVNSDLTRVEDFNGTDGQQWLVLPMGSGVYKLASANEQARTLSVPGGVNANLTFVKTQKGYTNDQWYLYRSGNSIMFRPSCSATRVLDVYGSPYGPGQWGKDVVTWDYLGGTNQWWTLRPSILSRDTVFIQSNGNSNYLSVKKESDGNNIATEFTSLHNKATQIWKVVPQGNYVSIHPTHNDKQVLLVNSNGNLVVSTYSSVTNNALWKVEGTNGNCTFKNQDTNEYLSTGGSNYWSVKIYNNDSYWGGNININMSNAYYTTRVSDGDIGGYQNVIPEDYYRTALNWNAISPNVNIMYIPKTSVDSGFTDGKELLTTFYRNNELGDGFLGMMIPNVGLGLLNGNWKYSEIELNHKELNNSTKDYIEKIILHEFGHALKLTHPRELISHNNGSHQPAYKESFFCVMMANADKNACCITQLDKSALRAKWGR